MTANIPMTARKQNMNRRWNPPLGDVPTIALVGRPNVGKSTLFNRLTHSKQALVASVPGTTRDRKEGAVRRERYLFKLIDTGGMGFGTDLGFSTEVEGQIDEALLEADLVWVVLDAKDGLNPFDGELVQKINRANIPCKIVINKVDNDQRVGAMAEFYRLGIEEMHPISATHGRGLDSLLEASAAAIPGIVAQQHADSNEEDLEDESRPLRVAFLGRPNVGKSSLINCVLDRSRMIVSEIAGTTREAVEIPFSLQGRDYILVDTAGIRRKSRTKEHLEKIGVLQSLGALNRVDVAILVVDGSEALAVQDARIASYILEHRRAVVVAMNKWDVVDSGKAPRAGQQAKDVEADAMQRLRFLDFAPMVRTSALEGSGIEQLFKEIDKAAIQFRRRVQTADLNRMVQAAVMRFPPPAKGHSPTRVNYGTQLGSGPPFFRFFTNHPDQIGDAYTRFFEHQLRHAFGFKGTPLRIEWKGRDEKRRHDHHRSDGSHSEPKGKSPVMKPARKSGGKREGR